MTECGLIPALLNVVQLNMDGQVREIGRARARACAHLFKKSITRHNSVVKSLEGLGYVVDT